jgi:hypothetical protein
MFLSKACEKRNDVRLALRIGTRCFYEALPNAAPQQQNHLRGRVKRATIALITKANAAQSKDPSDAGCERAKQNHNDAGVRIHGRDDSRRALGASALASRARLAA